MLKVFAFVGSRRIGNTHAAVQIFLDALREKLPQPPDVTLYTAADLALTACMGCNTCFLTGTCVRDSADNFNAVKEEMLQADLLIFASPVYAHDVSGDMKIFIDRLSYWLHLMRLAGKKSVVLSTSSTNGNELVNAYLVKMLEYLGTEVVANLPITVDRPRMLEDALFLNTVLPAAAEKTAARLNSGNFSASSRQEGYFKAMRQTYLQHPEGYEGRYWMETKLCAYESLNDYVHAELICKERAAQLC